MNLRPLSISASWRRVFLALCYAMVACSSLNMSFEGPNGFPVWIPSGIAFIAVWFWGGSIWPGIWLGSFIADMLVFPQNGWTPAQAVMGSALIGVVNTMEALLGVFLLRRFIGQARLLSKTGDIYKFVFAVLTATLCSAVLGTSAVYLIHPAPGAAFDITLLTWWMGNVIGVLTIAPLFLTFHRELWRWGSWKNNLEAALIVLILIAVNAGVFMGEFPEYGFYGHVTYMVLPIALWATYRFGYPAAALTILITSVFALIGSMLHIGVFAGHRVPMDCYIGIVAVTVLTLAAAIYERRKAEEDIKKKEARFRSLVEHSFEVIAMVDTNARVLYSSGPTQHMLGYDNAELLGHSIFEWIHPDDAQEVFDIFQGLLNTPGPAAHTICRVRRKNGKWRWMEGSGQNLLNNPAIGAVVINYRDVTERKQAEEVLRRDNESLEKLVDERSKELIKTQKDLKHFTRLADIGTLAATVAHELRNPLGVIQLAAYNLKREKSDLGANRHLANIEKKVWEGDQIINNLLNYSRIKIPHYEHVPILSVIDECVASVAGRFAEKGIGIEKVFSDGLKFIEADPNQIREIYINVLNNACQACLDRGGQVKLSAECQGDMAKVSVKDTGVGIAPDDMENIFQPFFTRKSKGTGLGLTICNELVNLHHGRIEIYSKLDEGTTVNIFLPIQRRHYAEAASH